MQTVAPVPFWNVPLSHAVQVLLLGRPANLPGVHATQSALLVEPWSGFAVPLRAMDG